MCRHFNEMVMKKYDDVAGTSAIERHAGVQLLAQAIGRSGSSVPAKTGKFEAVP